MMFGSKRSKLAGLSKPGDMTRTMNILGITLPDQQPKSTINTALPSPGDDSGKPAGSGVIRIVNFDDLQKPDNLDTRTIEVRIAWRDSNEMLQMNDSVRTTVNSIKTSPIVRKYTPDTTMELVVRECRDLFQPEDVELQVLSADGKAMDGCDTFEQLVASRRLVVGSDIDIMDSGNSKRTYALQLSLRRHSARAPPSNKEDILHHQPVPLQVNSVQELLDHIMKMDLSAIKKLTIDMELVNGDRLVLTGVM